MNKENSTKSRRKYLLIILIVLCVVNPDHHGIDRMISIQVVSLLIIFSREIFRIGRDLWKLFVYILLNLVIKLNWNRMFIHCRDELCIDFRQTCILSDQTCYSTWSLYFEQIHFHTKVLQMKSRCWILLNRTSMQEKTLRSRSYPSCSILFIAFVSFKCISYFTIEFVNYLEKWIRELNNTHIISDWNVWSVFISWNLCILYILHCVSLSRTF